MQLSFDTEVAKMVGSDAAVLFQNICFWVWHNETNRSEEHLHDGKYWTYNSNRAFTEQFDYLTGDQVRTCIGKLKKAGLIVTGNHNKNPHDRTLWFAVGPSGEALYRRMFDRDCAAKSPNPCAENPKSICEKYQIEEGNLANRNGRNRNSLIGTDINPYTDTDVSNARAPEASPQTSSIVVPYPRTPEEVMEQAKALCIPMARVQAQAFLDHYESTGWMLSGNIAIRDWRRRIARWVDRQREIDAKAGGQQQTRQIDRRDYSDF